VFWQVEGQTGLYVLFKTVCDTYDLLPAENYKLPPEAEGLEPIEEARAPVPSIMKSSPAQGNSLAVEEDFISVGRTNTRRHIRQSPSVGSAVTTVLESDEEEADVTQKLEELQIAEEEGDTEVPVIVETYEVDENHEAEDEQQESEPVGQSENSTGQTESATSTTSSWDRMSSDSLEDKEEPQEHEKTHEQEHTESEVNVEEDDAKTPATKIRETFHDRPTAPVLESADEEKKADES